MKNRVKNNNYHDKKKEFNLQEALHKNYRYAANYQSPKENDGFFENIGYNKKRSSHALFNNSYSYEIKDN